MAANPIIEVDFFVHTTTIKLQSFIESMKAYDRRDGIFSDPYLFQNVIKYVTQNKIIKSSEIEKEFEFDKSTISRWANGKSLPHKIIRDNIIKGIFEIAEQKLKEQENIESDDMQSHIRQVKRL